MKFWVFKGSLISLILLNGSVFCFGLLPAQKQMSQLMHYNAQQTQQYAVYKVYRERSAHYAVLKPVTLDQLKSVLPATINMLPIFKYGQLVSVRLSGCMHYKAVIQLLNALLRVPMRLGLHSILLNQLPSTTCFKSVIMLSLEGV